MTEMQQRVDERWKFVQDVYLPVYEDAPDHPDGDCIYAPPSRIVAVDVVGDRAFLSVRKYEESNKTTTTTTLIEECVSAEALLNALVMQMGVEFVQGVLRAGSDARRATTAAPGGQR